ncbi:plasmid pRiA4b ORF-3 family protein [Salimicrobium flavidum]|uniref:PRiA4b ORF-3-like protein n=1 Tax=Salimicrobium flavidum TaxID=570947 RepID=A0A1N7IRK0_9BACI|nr:plasmid pRiA4b ORF-3 family protein [Salimicrobium flavidum]SIS39712.1 pRiA4b ORF-3-like protein [Salimicrobium flavidum]
MIYILRITLQDVENKVERVIHIDEEEDFAMLHEAIRESFEWSDTHLHQFMIGRKRIMPIFDPDEFKGENVKDEEEALLLDYLRVGESIDYIYDLGDWWGHKILVEDKREGPLTGSYLIEETIGEAPDEDSMILEEEDSPVWESLITLAKEFKQKKPWKKYTDEQIIVLEIPWMNQLVFCSVLGGGGYEFGLAVYIGEDGLNVLEGTVEGTIEPEDVPFVQRSILISFSDRDELEQEDYQLLKDNGFTFRGKKQWPMFRSFRPGFFPWFIDEEEAEIAAYALDKVLDVRSRNLHIPSYEEPHWYANLISGNEFIDTTISPEEYQDGEMRPMILSEFEEKRIRKEKKVLDMQLVIGTFTFHEPVEGGDTRPFYPEVFVAVDEQGEGILYNDTFPPDDLAFRAQYAFLETIKQLGGVPASVKLQVSEATYGLLPLLEKLGIPYEEEISIPVIKEVEEFMKQMDV